MSSAVYNLTKEWSRGTISTKTTFLIFRFYIREYIPPTFEYCNQDSTQQRFGDNYSEGRYIY